MTVLELVEAGAQRLHQAGVSFGHGTENAFDEAAWLVLWRLGFTPHAFDAVSHTAVTRQQQRQALDTIAQRISTRKPAAYLTGEAWLQGLAFAVDERVIVPRSLIAELIADGTLDAWLPSENSAHSVRLLDLCTGNGSLAVLAALAWDWAQIDASDISAAALAVAQRNIGKHGVAERVNLIRADGLEGLPPQRYDLILCNPPYVNDRSMAALPPEYCAEPRLALAGGADGMDFIRPLLKQVRRRLKPQGALVLEIGHERQHFEAAFPRLNPVWLHTSAGDDQVLLLSAHDLV